MSIVPQLKEELRKVGTGYGMMSLTWKAEPVPESQAQDAMLKAIQLAKANGSKAFFNVAEFYGPDFINLVYVKNFFTKYPELRKDVIVSCKGSFDVQKFVPLGKADDVRRSVENCVSAMGGFIDIFEVARIDTSIIPPGQDYPYETFETLAEMVENGAIGGISLSEVDEKQIRAIAKDWIKYLTCVEVELSLFSPQILSNGVAKACSDLGLVIICYSPLGRGLLTGKFTSTSDIPAGDFRLALKRFQGDAMKQNLLLTQFLASEIVAKRDAAHPINLPQVALGWIKHWNKEKEFSGAKFIPIPSGSSAERVTENFDESRSQLTDEEFKKISDFLKDFTTVGDRYETA
ncbi:hypothetical protein Kpol_1039p78 [Vanderwaltozyma polyspora DSM 70294]|uniref:NADP-dependent oxidoreductase domain-containing protein n=1 Tax=Vanderwaltozyma polyspora (strain ATCC 22028 / DSM 70294 / BCRC 21397 / CBS 2163 / NBRC 10782 / NRRL Y-8283 / UCD 57-17) TaxID=436907 RepID=A7THK5_VANPO|nr:uncharacterized protein Kpol_1039p78 [Vanderwaltozyma polyspora DSM 70294]EDO18329.1 hypothetical protein Kpol_1039p78 [Vanderwaltozyma polyspora DSM 70294]